MFGINVNNIKNGWLRAQLAVSTAKDKFISHLSPFSRSTGLSDDLLSDFEKKSPPTSSWAISAFGRGTTCAHLLLYHLAYQLGDEKNSGKYHIQPRLYITAVTASGLLSLTTTILQEKTAYKLSQASWFFSTMTQAAFALTGMATTINFATSSQSIDASGIGGENYLLFAGPVMLCASGAMSYKSLDNRFARNATKSSLLKIACSEGDQINQQPGQRRPSLTHRVAKSHVNRVQNFSGGCSKSQGFFHVVTNGLKGSGATVAAKGSLRLISTTFSESRVEFSIQTVGV